MTTETTDDTTEEQTTASEHSFPQRLVIEELHSGNVWSPDGEHIEAHIMPGDLDRADEIAAEHGFERVDDELDHRTYAPVHDE